jgi:hypothetical protein
MAFGVNSCDISANYGVFYYSDSQDAESAAPEITEVIVRAMKAAPEAPKSLEEKALQPRHLMRGDQKECNQRLSDLPPPACRLFASGAIRGF